MISFRYHIVTIVAVFLALALGLLGGSTFVQPALQRELERRTDAYRETAASLRDEITELRAQTAGMGAFADAALPYLTRDRLPGRRVVLVVQDGVEDAVLAEALGSLDDAGAEVVATLTAQESIADTEPDVQAQLAEALGLPAGSVVDAETVADALAMRLASGAPSDAVADAAEGPDVLAELLTAGFVTASDGTPLEEVGGPGQTVVVLGGGPSEEPVLAPEAFAAPLVVGLADRGVNVGAGESSTTPPAVSFVDLVRDDVGEAVVTVDALELTMGGAALVLGLEQLQRTGVGGSYGLDDDADPLPPLP